jgi:DNA invertase Pin-like site-specific DNA recombinase
MESLEKSENLEYFAYLRESVDLETGIAIQKDFIEKYCNFKGVRISKWFIDNDRSAYKYRPKYDSMMIEILSTECKASGVICSSLSRFGRNTAETLTEHNRLKKVNKELILVKDNIDSNTILGKAMMGMLAVFNDFERDVIVERLANGRAWAKINGTKSGKPANRPEIKINWKLFDENKKIGLSIPNIAKVMGISKSKLYNAVKERTL